MSDRRQQHGSSADSGTYDVEPVDFPRPALPGSTVSAPGLDELIDLLAADLVIHCENCVREFGDVHLAFSGDPSLEPLYMRLMYDPNCRRLPWRRAHVWMVDELNVPFDDQRSRSRLLSDLIGDHADIPGEQFHPIFAGADRAAEEYESQLRETLAWREKGHDRLDYVLLALDPEGGAGGFSSATSEAVLRDVREEAALVQTVDSAPPHNLRAVTLAPRLINAARFVAVMAAGEHHAPTLQRLAELGGPSSEVPASWIRPHQGELRWYVDAPACSLAEE